MEISCKNCRKTLNIPDEKIPEGKSFSLRCPGCKAKIAVDLKPREKKDQTLASGWDQASEAEAGPETGPESGIDEYKSSEKPFDFLEEEGNTAIVCENDPVAVKKIKEVLDIMEYSTTVAENVRDALRKMKYHVYDMILVNENFDGSDPDSNGILIYLERLNMDVRRNIFVGLISKRVATMDNMTAFLKSVNITINPRDIDSIDRIIGRGLYENELFYTVFRESMKKAGRI